MYCMQILNTHIFLADLDIVVGDLALLIKVLTKFHYHSYFHLLSLLAGFGVIVSCNSINRNEC